MSLCQPWTYDHTHHLNRVVPPRFTLFVSIVIFPCYTTFILFLYFSNENILNTYFFAFIYEPSHQKRPQVYFIKNLILHLYKRELVLNKMQKTPSKKKPPIPKLCQFLLVATYWDWLQSMHLVAPFSKNHLSGLRALSSSDGSCICIYTNL